MRAKYILMLLVFLSLISFAWAANENETESLSKSWGEVYGKVARQNAQNAYQKAEKQYAAKNFKEAYKNYRKVLQFLNEIKANKAFTKPDEDLQNIAAARLNTLSLEGQSTPPEEAAPPKPVLVWKTPPAKTEAPVKPEVSQGSPAEPSASPQQTQEVEVSQSQVNESEAVNTPVMPVESKKGRAGFVVKEAVAGQQVKKVNLFIYAYPEGATIYIEGKNYGKAPQTLALEPGTYLIRISQTPYPDYLKKVILLDEQPQVLSADLSRGLPLASLSIASIPQGASLYLDNKFAGQSPQILEGLIPGKYLISLRKPGYFRKSLKLTLGSSEHKVLNLSLIPFPSEELVTSRYELIFIVPLLVLLIILAVLWFKALRKQQ
jgi:hypothetical protein